MKKIILLLSITLSLLMYGCSDSKTFIKNDGNSFTAEPYGFANKEEKIDGVKYKANIPNIILGCLFSETLIVPIYITGWNFFEPVEYYEHTNSK